MSVSTTIRQSFDDASQTEKGTSISPSHDRSEADVEESGTDDLEDGQKRSPSGGSTASDPPPPPSPPPPPDGGVTAWIQVLCGFIMFWHAWGLVNSYGVFQQYYSTVLLPTESDSNLSWIGSLQGAALACTTIFAGPLFDAGHGRALV
ncbi:putative transporter MCH4, partial [Teratosphaeria destructans]